MNANTNLTEEIICARFAERKWPVLLAVGGTTITGNELPPQHVSVSYWAKRNDSDHVALMRFIDSIDAAVVASQYLPVWFTIHNPEEFCEPVLRLLVRLLNIGSGVKLPNGRRIPFWRDRIVFWIVFCESDPRIARVVDLILGYRPPRRARNRQSTNNGQS